MFVFWKVLQHFPKFYSSLKKNLPILDAFPLCIFFEYANHETVCGRINDILGYKELNKFG